jgi:anti-sigma regulatory factor (Ser/Thr protein kinase)
VADLFRFAAGDYGVPAAARAVARGWIEGQFPRAEGHASGGAPIADDIILIVSELVTNSLRARAQSVSVRLRRLHDSIEIHVQDNGEGWPTLQSPTESDLHGRGLVIVGALSSEWGVTACSNDETAVWAKVALLPAAARK